MNLIFFFPIFLAIVCASPTSNNRGLVGNFAGLGNNYNFRANPGYCYAAAKNDIPHTPCHLKIKLCTPGYFPSYPFESDDQGNCPCQCDEEWLHPASSLFIHELNSIWNIDFEDKISCFIQCEIQYISLLYSRVQNYIAQCSYIKNSTVQCS